MAEAALYKNEDDSQANVDVGAPGGWNSTTLPRWYFLQKTKQLSFTDAEIRGGLDGLILGKLYRDKLSRFRSSLKLSQLIEMYYTRGVFDERLRACERQGLYKEFAPEDEMETQTYAFALLLNKEVRLSLSYNDDAVEKLVRDATKALDEYIRKFLIFFLRHYILTKFSNKFACNNIHYSDIFNRIGSYKL